ncbi:3-hydroxyacyl-CoA dehydrogenase [Microbacterium foliorum]|uniref:Putative 3-hydroxybutyryl-CoA dehydrogenase n=1 Tax=Microbacterium foliorum TaxID=104336 RepID=A0A0F0KCJ2_9MICO|nr:3-hydroxyacyl-CoA dehydrogenase [Microbacterium foliorum]AXL11968.1 3-hydroxyacyl-CoA dehydrogenase [Microbacterium foliorum]KJL17875.1 putative 3-hydroxybutyryl-CoA dehydrogenase [Microbacterium foliorum]
MKNITVLGTGVLGSQIAFQTAFHGFDVVAYDIDQAALDRAAERFDALAARYVADGVENAAGGGAEAAIARIRLTSELTDAAAAADLIIEAVPENLELKQSIYRTLADAAPETTIFATNSSTLLPSALAASTGRPDRFLALHFANEIWSHNTAEVMGTPETDPAVYDAVVAFAAEIGMVPIPIKKEKAGYLLNSMLVPFLEAGAGLLVDGIADPEAIDATWRIGTGAPAGPFEIYDVVGLTTAYNISRMGGEKQQRFAQLLKEQYIDKGKLGVSTGEGFYTYPRAN